MAATRLLRKGQRGALLTFWRRLPVIVRASVRIDVCENDMRTSRPSFPLSACLLSATLSGAACGSPPPRESQTKVPSGDATFNEVARAYLEDLYKRQPTQATFLGIHKYDYQLEPYSRQAAMDGVASAKAFRDRVAAIDADSLSAVIQLDREQLLHAIDSRLLTL